MIQAMKFSRLLLVVCTLQLALGADDFSMATVYRSLGISVGDDVQVSKAGYAFATHESRLEFTKFNAAKDSEAIESLVSEGRLLRMEAGTRLRVIRADLSALEPLRELLNSAFQIKLDTWRYCNKLRLYAISRGVKNPSTCVVPNSSQVNLETFTAYANDLEAIASSEEKIRASTFDEFVAAFARSHTTLECRKLGTKDTKTFLLPATLCEKIPSEGSTAK